MRAREAGFTLLEMVVAIGVALILLAAGGYWMLSMRPGALRGALDDFDSNVAAAKTLAASSGNGATLVFAPQTGGAPGFTLRVYSGRPNASNAVTTTNTMAAISATSVSEAHFGKPPFAIFLNSAGYPTGSANYPTLDAQENPTFGVIAQQPPCPSGGIVLTFTSPQGVTATRTLPCNTDVAFAAGADPTPTPNPPHISPTYLLAHYTTDSGPLKFKAAEYGYYHWYASTQNGPACQMGNSDTGAAPATFASPWPYAQPSPSSQGAAAPAAPEFAPYTWPVGDPNDPPAWFQLSPVLHNGGMCTVTVADDYNQSGTVQVQVMGDLTPSTTSPPTMTVGGSGQTITFSKTFDTEQLLLWAGGPCLGIVSVSTQSLSFPSPPPSHAQAMASVTITPIAQGSCNLVVQDQYGEQVSLGVKVNAQMASWPEQIELGANGSALSYAPTRPFDPATVINATLFGGVAQAATTAGCMAYALTTGGAPDVAPSQANAVGVYTDVNGCYLSGNAGAVTSTASVVVWEPSGQSGDYNLQNACSNVILGAWNPGSQGIQSGLPMIAGSAAGSCNIGITDGSATMPTVDHGLTNIVVQAAALYATVTCTGFIDQAGDRGCSVACEGTSGGCSSSGQSIMFPCSGTNGLGPFDVTTGEGTDTTGLQINPGQNISVTTSSDGTAFVSASNCAPS
jgi:prepilin-type N-terminal cleavage/methylation domain-containing protein